MTVHLDDEALRAGAVAWHESLSPSAPHPVPPEVTDPGSAPIVAALGDWLAVHADMCGQREASAAAIIGKAQTDAAVLPQADTDGAVLIETSREV
jgi:hypothetical protein